MLFAWHQQECIANYTIELNKIISEVENCAFSVIINKYIVRLLYRH